MQRAWRGSEVLPEVDRRKLLLVGELEVGRTRDLKSLLGPRRTECGDDGQIDIAAVATPPAEAQRGAEGMKKDEFRQQLQMKVLCTCAYRSGM